MKKIIIAINNTFIRETYSEIFKKEGFVVSETDEGEVVKNFIKEEKPDIIIADMDLSQIGGIELLKTIKEEFSDVNIPVIIFVQFEKEGDRKKATQAEAKDFITAAECTPLEVVRRVKVALGEQKSYRIHIDKNLHDAPKLILDLGYNSDFKCPKCGSDLLLYLMRDLSRGEKYFILSTFCDKCGK
jgi:DNA-binding response OmpR family regulator